MRVFSGVIFISLGLLSLTRQSREVFPIPVGMQEVWPGVKLSGSDKQLLQKAMEPDLRALGDEPQSNKKFTVNHVDYAEIALGRLGKGVIISVSDSVVCGTGGCPIYAYVREQKGYRKVLDSFGWAFAVVDSKGVIPDLVIASNGGGGQISLTRYR